MPITTNLNSAPYNDDFDTNKQYYRVLFKPRYAVQARELNQLQSMLQNQIERFGEHILQEGAILKGCNITYLNNLNYVRLADKPGFDVFDYQSEILEDESEIYYELRGTNANLKASIVFGDRGFESRYPDLNTFYINYLNSSTNISDLEVKQFESGELLNIYKITVVDDEIVSETLMTSVNVATTSGFVGNSYGIIVDDGIIFQNGHFLYSNEQLVIVSKYNKTPTGVSVGFRTVEKIVTSLQDTSLFDNANGSPNRNAPGADRLQLVPTLTVSNTVDAEKDGQFFTILQFTNGEPRQVKDVSEFASISEKIAKGIHEESGDYVVKPFNTKIIERDDQLTFVLGGGVAYVGGYRVENRGEVHFDIDDIEGTTIQEEQRIGLDYGRYLSVANSNPQGRINIGTYDTVSLRNISNTEIGTAIAISLSEDRVYLDEIDMNSGQSFSSVARVLDTSGSGFVSVTPTVKKATQTPLVFDTGMFSLKSVSNISIPVRTYSAVNITSNPFTITASVGETFSDIEDLDLLVLTSANVKLEISSSSVSLDGQTLTITLSAPSLPYNGSRVYYNKRIENAEPYALLKKEPYIRSLYNSSITKYNLGFPNVIEILEVKDINGNDFTTSFRLNINQNDSYYDHSFMEYIPGRKQPAAGNMTIKLKVLQINTSTGLYFFTVDSYPISIDSNEIPVYNSSDNVYYNLRDCIDFRPYVDVVSGADYDFATPSGAPIIPDDIDLTPSFTGSFLIPAHNNTIIADYEFYLNRTDLITIDGYGKISHVVGKEEISSKAPEVRNRIVIAEIYVPGFPALTSQRAIAENRKEYAVRFRDTAVPNFTMKDIQAIKKNLDDLTSYTVLSALENEAKNINVLDEFGMPRFKNGILVESFENFTSANVRNREFKSSIDFTEKVLNPAVKMTPLALRVKSTSNVSLSPTTPNAKLASQFIDDNTILLTQPYATSWRNCVSNYYSYQSYGKLYPEYDAAYDSISEPDSNIEFDISTASVDNIHDLMPLVSTKSERLLKSASYQSKENPSKSGYNTSVQLQNLLTQMQMKKTVFEGEVSDFAKNTKYQPYIRARKVNAIFTGLRPNTRHYAFFDKVAIEQYVAPGSYFSDPNGVTINGSYGDALVTDNKGRLAIVFDLPTNLFFTGDRMLEIADTNVYTDVETISTSYGFVSYRAFNYNPKERNGFSPSTRSYDFSTNQAITTRTVVDRPVSTANLRSTDKKDRTTDPVTQTFYIKESMCPDSQCLFVSKVELFFKRKSPLYGVTIELREVIDGYPSQVTIPFSRVHLDSSDVNISDDGALSTTINFEGPIRLDSEKEYAFSIIPDGGDSDYLVYTARTGEVDLFDQTSVTRDWGDGHLYTATNNRAWQIIYDEDLKFRLFKYEFDIAAGTLTLTNKDHEFFTLEDVVDDFKIGELVYSEKVSTGTATVTYGDNEITTASAFDFATVYSIGDFILLYTALEKQIFEISGVTTNTLTLIGNTVFKTSLGEEYNGTVTTRAIVKGEVITYNPINNTQLVLENSSAKSGRIFIGTDDIVGIESGATATITAVNNINLSYIQPMINRVNSFTTRNSVIGRFTNISDPSTNYTLDVSYNDKTSFNSNGMVLYSRSNDVLLVRPFEFEIEMNTSSNLTSSIIDVETAMIFAYQYQITNTSSTTSKYISKVITLPENSDAEDFLLYLTAYRPKDTQIRAYIKVQNMADSYNFNSNNWIELRLVDGAASFSSDTNYYDMKQFIYEVPVANKPVSALRYTNPTGAIFDGYRRFAIKLELLSPTIHRTPRVRDFSGIALT